MSESRFIADNRAMRCGSELLACPFCAGSASVVRDSTIFVGQDYGDRYPRNVSTQNHGYNVRCEKCGCQTCWWHYEQEATDAWNSRAENAAEVLRQRDEAREWAEEERSKHCHPDHGGQLFPWENAEVKDANE